MATISFGDESIPERLRQRIESWARNQPKTQFQQYGPLNAFLSIKFPPSKFLVKPQALLREVWPKLDGVAEARVAMTGLADPTMDVDGVEEVREEVRQGRVSIDSQNAFVYPNAKSYPDFVVTVYSSVLDGGDDDSDVIRLVIEVGSLGRDRNPSQLDKKHVVDQLLDYLARMGTESYRWRDRAFGIAIMGTEFLAIKSTKQATFKKSGEGWKSLYSNDFLQLIDKISKLEI
ncbi:hypothetical protein F5I97DRAFT_1829129 [Phlebopus sp. FC_14]|nr:hypothetical protein F5I97DRAFT_1829129 [Phlebopus sp. FC_14]